MENLVKECAYCGKEFTPTFKQSHQKYCSTECSCKLNNKRAKIRKLKHQLERCSA